MAPELVLATHACGGKLNFGLHQTSRQSLETWSWVDYPIGWQKQPPNLLANQFQLNETPVRSLNCKIELLTSQEIGQAENGWSRPQMKRFAGEMKKAATNLVVERPAQRLKMACFRAA